MNAEALEASPTPLAVRVKCLSGATTRIREIRYEDAEPSTEGGPLMTSRPDSVKVYEDAAGEWRWRRRAGNNRITAVSGEGYGRKHDAFKAAIRENPDGIVSYLDDDPDPPDWPAGGEDLPPDEQ